MCVDRQRFYLVYKCSRVWHFSVQLSPFVRILCLTCKTNGLPGMITRLIYFSGRSIRVPWKCFVTICVSSGKRWTNWHWTEEKETPQSFSWSCFFGQHGSIVLQQQQVLGSVWGELDTSLRRRLLALPLRLPCNVSCVRDWWCIHDGMWPIRYCLAFEDERRMLVAKFLVL